MIQHLHVIENVSTSSCLIENDSKFICFIENDSRFIRLIENHQSAKSNWIVMLQKRAGCETRLHCLTFGGNLGGIVV